MGQGQGLPQPVGEDPAGPADPLRRAGQGLGGEVLEGALHVAQPILDHLLEQAVLDGEADGPLHLVGQVQLDPDRLLQGALKLLIPGKAQPAAEPDHAGGTGARAVRDGLQGGEGELLHMGIKVGGDRVLSLGHAGELLLDQLREVHKIVPLSNEFPGFFEKSGNSIVATGAVPRQERSGKKCRILHYKISIAEIPSKVNRPFCTKKYKNILRNIQI